MKKRLVRPLEALVVLLLIDLCASMNDEGRALLRFREKVELDPYDALSDWDESNGFDPCWWFGVECSRERRVVALNLKHLCLKGTLAAELGKLIHLKFLILQNNSFSGSIPREFGDLHKLKVLDLGDNNLSGPVPSDLGRSLSLEFLVLKGNRLIDSLPSELHEINILSELQIDEGLLYSEERCVTRSSGNTIRRLLQVGGEDRVWHHRSENNKIKPQVSLVAKSQSPIALDNGLAPLTSPILSPFLPPVVSPSPSAFSPSMLFPPSQSIQFPTPGPSLSPVTNPLSPVQEPNLVGPPSTFPPSPSQSPSAQTVSKRKSTKTLTIYMSILGVSSLLAFCAVYFLCCQAESRVTVRPWATGLSGQLQKAFVTGVPALRRSEVETACEDFSNIIGSLSDCNVYKGTLSSGVEIAVVSTVITSAKDWSKQSESQFRMKISTLSKVNHKNFMNLIGYCEQQEPFTRMMVFEYAPNGTLFEHLHVKEAEHSNWVARLRIAVGVAYCLEHLHQLNPPVILNHLDSSTIYLTDDYASKVGDLRFWNKARESQSQSFSGPLEVPVPTREHIVYKFGLLMLEIMSGTHPSSEESIILDHWVSSYLDGTKPIEDMIDPSLASFSGEDAEALFVVIRSCTNPNPESRPTMGEVATILKDITAVPPNGATPRVSPLWWAELEILASEAS